MHQKEERLTTYKEEISEHAPYRPIPVHLRKKVNDEIKFMVDQDIIEPVTGPVEWCSNPVIVPKPNSDDIRITVDLRAVNKSLQDTHKPIPSVEALKTTFHSKTIFSKMDFRSAFSQIEIEEKSRKFLVFRVENQLFQYKRMTMGLLPASGEFMNAIAPQFDDIKQVTMIHDDVIISGETQEDHDEGVRAFLQRTSDLNLTLNESKCIISKHEVSFWGLIISKNGIKPNPLKIKTLEQQTRPQNKDELISFLAMVRSNTDFYTEHCEGDCIIT